MPDYPNMYTDTGGRPGYPIGVTPNSIARNAYYPEGDQARFGDTKEKK